MKRDHNMECAMTIIRVVGCHPPQVQRSWMYLENIFIGSEDIRKQLPAESLSFEQVHASFLQHMRDLYTTGNVVKVRGPLFLVTRKMLYTIVS